MLSLGKSGLCQRDRDFIVQLTTAEIQNHLTDIKRIAKEVVPGLHQNYVFFQINYMMTPPAFQLRKMEETSANYAKLKSLSDRFILWLEVRVPTGDNSFEQITHFSFSADLLKENEDDEEDDDAGDMITGRLSYSADGKDSGEGDAVMLKARRDRVLDILDYLEIEKRRRGNQIYYNDLVELVEEHIRTIPLKREHF